MSFLSRDPNNPRIGIESNVDPSTLASPLDLQTGAARTLDAQRRASERAAALKGSLAAYEDNGAAPAAAQSQATRGGSALERFQPYTSSQGDFSVMDVGKGDDAEDWYNLPVWQRDQILQQMLSRRDAPPQEKK